MSCVASRGSSRPRTSTFSSWADLLPSAHPNEIVQLTDLVTAVELARPNGTARLGHAAIIEAP